jgi:hypothetical protein
LQRFESLLLTPATILGTPAEAEFIRSFLLHSLPSGFVRIRHYGFLANRNRNQHLNAIRDLMGLSAPPEKQVASLEKMMLQLTGTDLNCYRQKPQVSCVLRMAKCP